MKAHVEYDFQPGRRAGEDEITSEIIVSQVLSTVGFVAAERGSGVWNSCIEIAA